jgi:hypothetical protein
MKQEQHFDKIIRKKMEDAESDFPFDQSNWEKASAMLDAERGTSAGKNSKLFLLFGALFIVLGTGGFFAYKYMDNKDSSVLSSVLSEPKTVAENVNTAKVTESNVPETHIAPATDETTKTVSNNETKEKVNTKKSDDKIKTDDEFKQNHNPALSSVEPVKNNHTENSVETNSKNENVNTENTASEKIAGTTVVKPLIPASANKKGSILAPLGSSGNKAKPVTVKPVELTESHDEMAVEAGSNMYENLFLNSKITKIPSHELDDEIKKTPYDFIRIYDEDYYKNKRRKFHFLDAEAGVNYMFGWDTPAGKDGKGVNGYAGLNYGFHIHKKLSASVGAQIYNLSHITQPFYSGSDLTYGFGANGTHTTIASNSLYYFAIPLKVNFAIDKRNTIGAGVNAAFLFNAQNTVESYNVYDGVKTNVVSDKNTGYYQGTNTKNIMLTAFYSRAVMPRLKLNAEVMFGLSDVFIHTSVSKYKQNPVGLRMGVQYTLFDK